MKESIVDEMTVVLATYNRANILQGTLESLCHVLPPECPWRLIVVNNACDDHTDQVLGQFMHRLPLQCLREPVRGKNRALNTALEHIHAGFVIFTDDDIFFQRDWLLSYEEIFATRTEYEVFGGTVLPEWGQPPPSYVWKMRMSIKGAAYALTEQWLSDGEIQADYIYGPNMAIHSSIFTKGYRFHEGLGPNGEQYAQGGETEFTKRLADDGYRCCHIKKAIVYHRISAGHLSKQWIYERAIRFGRGQVYLRSLRKNQDMVRAMLYQFMLILRLCKSVLWGLIIFPMTRMARYYEFVECRWDINVARGAVMASHHVLKALALKART